MGYPSRRGSAGKGRCGCSVQLPPFKMQKIPQLSSAGTRGRVLVCDTNLEGES